MRLEARKNTRRFVRNGARMIALDGSALGACLVIDISGTGARLGVDTAKTLPDKLILLLSHDGQLRRYCTVAWRAEGSVGVQFFSGRSNKPQQQQ
jgi:hypothetical protein